MAKIVSKWAKGKREVTIANDDGSKYVNGELVTQPKQPITIEEYEKDLSWLIPNSQKDCAEA